MTENLAFNETNQTWTTEDYQTLIADVTDKINTIILNMFNKEKIKHFLGI